MNHSLKIFLLSDTNNGMAVYLGQMAIAIFGLTRAHIVMLYTLKKMKCNVIRMRFFLLIGINVTYITRFPFWAFSVLAVRFLLGSTLIGGRGPRKLISYSADFFYENLIPI